MGLTQNTLGCAKGAAPCCYPGDSFSKPQRVGLRCWGGGVQGAGGLFPRMLPLVHADTGHGRLSRLTASTK